MELDAFRKKNLVRILKNHSLRTQTYFRSSRKKAQDLEFSGTYGSAPRGYSTRGNGFQRPYFLCGKYRKINKAFCLEATINILFDTEKTTRKKYA